MDAVNNFKPYTWHLLTLSKHLSPCQEASYGTFPPYKLYHQNTSISWRSILIIMRVIILANNGQCKQSDVRCGVKQVCVIAPTLFIIFIAIVIDMMKDDQPPRIEIVYRGNGRVFKLALLRSKTKS